MYNGSFIPSLMLTTGVHSILVSFKNFYTSLSFLSFGFVITTSVMARCDISNAFHIISITSMIMVRSKLI